MKSMLGKISFRILNGGILGLFMLTVLYYTIGANSVFIWKLQDLDLFINTPQFFFDTTNKIGGLSLYISSFLNQFFYYPWIGSIIYLFILLIVRYLTAKAFDFTGRKFSLSLIPSLALLLSMTELGYMIYTLKIVGFVYVSAIGIICALSGLILFKKQKSLLSQSVFIFIYLLVVYPICGAYALLGAILILLYSLKQAVIGKDKRQFIPALVSLICIYPIPFFYYQFVFNQTCFENLFYINLPDFLWNGPERLLWIPYFLIVFFLVVAVLWNKLNKAEAKLSFLERALPFTLFLASLVIVDSLSYKDKNFKTELSMIAASEKGEWNKVLQLSKMNPEVPTRLIVMNTQLALFKLGLSEEIYQYKDGNKAINSPREILPINIAGIFFYYQYGNVNYCYKWCMEDMVEYGMSASVMKYFVLTSLLNGETSLAQKYNDVLKSTLFHQSWAMDHQSYIDDPGKTAKAPEFIGLLPLLAYSNNLEGDQNMLEAYLKNSFANKKGDSSALLELSILSNLNMKNIEHFWPKFFLWNRTHESIPIHFQEAALLYHQMKPQENIDQVLFDQEVLTNFKNFMAFSQKYNGYSNESVQSLYYKQFGNTFWYYFFFVKDHPKG